MTVALVTVVVPVTVAYAEFFSAEIENANTRRKYRYNVDRFLTWLADRSIAWQQVSAPVPCWMLDQTKCDACVLWDCPRLDRSPFGFTAHK